MTDFENPDTFAMIFDRSEYRSKFGSSATVHRCGDYPGTFEMQNGDACEIQLVNWSTVKFTGTREQIRASLDQLELAYDRLVHPPVPTTPGTRAAAPTWTGD